MQVGWIILGLAAAAAVLALVLLRARDRHARETELLERVRSSALYSKLYPMLEMYDQCCIEQVIIRPEEMRVKLYKPMNRVYHSNFEELGADVVDQPQTLRSLARAIAVDVPCLADPAKYYFVERSAPRDAGGKDVWYEYNVQPDYKDQLLRAWYDQRDPEEGIVR